MLRNIAALSLALALSVGGCPSTPEADSGTAAKNCSTTLYDDTSRAGFNPPVGFTQSSGCTGPCRIAVAANPAAVLTMFSFARHAGGLQAAVDDWNARGPTGEPGFLVNFSGPLTLASGTPAIVTEWYSPTTGEYFTEAWARTSTRDVQLSAHFLDSALELGDAMAAAIGSLCVD
ncbi:MAG: hypothetical protein IT450_13210 [Phycisphaerales bacterium]|nr:hypothetical protein [Phycisphaerales bacterium]